MLTAAQLATLLERSAGGEGVRAVLAEFGCDNDDTLEWLKQHHGKLKEAKREYQRRLMLPEDAKASRDLMEMAANVEALPRAD